MVDRVLGANLLPHGGGYRYPHFTGVRRVIEDGPDQRRFEMGRTDGTTETLTDPRSQAYGYRGLEIIDRLRDLGLGDLVLESRVEYVIRDGLAGDERPQA